MPYTCNEVWPCNVDIGMGMGFVAVPAPSVAKVAVLLLLLLLVTRVNQYFLTYIPTPRRAWPHSSGSEFVSLPHTMGDYWPIVW